MGSNYVIVKVAFYTSCPDRTPQYIVAWNGVLHGVAVHLASSSSPVLTSFISPSLEAESSEVLPLNAYLLSHHCKGLKPALPIFSKNDLFCPYIAEKVTISNVMLLVYCGPYLRCCPRCFVSFLSFSICLSMAWNTAHLA